MKERQVEIRELQCNLTGCLEEVQDGTTLLLNNGEHRMARIVPEPRQRDALQDAPENLPGKGRLARVRPRPRLPAESTMADIVRENRW